MRPVLVYRGRRVSFACNPHILVELKRRGVIENEFEMNRISAEVFHDGPLIRFIHDKGLQQDNAVGTGIKPLYHEEVWSADDGYRVIQRFHERGLVAVGKINAGSGGAGISFFPVGQTSAGVRSGLAAMVASAMQHYGLGTERTLFPLRFFEFARSTGFILSDRPHLWDLRMLCLVWPEFVDVTPCVIRICPNPFDGHTYSRKSVVSNLSNRPPSLEFVRSAMDVSAMSAAGIDAVILQKMIHACAAWCGKGCVF